jgi:hypothetical protein
LISIQQRTQDGKDGNLFVFFTWFLELHRRFAASRFVVWCLILFGRRCGVDYDSTGSTNELNMDSPLTQLLKKIRLFGRRE